MKKILVLTDLSENVKHLSQTAIMLAEKLHADILLFNSYETIPVTSFYGAGPWIGEDEGWWGQESRAKLDKIAVELQQTLHRLLPGEQWRPQVSIQCLEGGVAEHVKDIIAHQDIELVIMGSSKDTRFDHLLFGNVTKSVIAHATRPVIILPPGVELAEISKVVFATDFDSADIKAVNYLSRLAAMLHYRLEIVHVELLEEQRRAEMEDKKVFLAMVEDLNFPDLVHTEVRGKEVVPRLIRLCKEQKVNLLGLIHHHDSLLVRMIRQSTANDLLENQAISLIIFPSKMS
jgi:nucleotide-binding universal stress UspA family protein